MSKNKKIGNLGEDLALQHCLQNGYELIEKNWTIGHKEIDLIFKKEDIYIFVEVKTRTNLKMGMPENAISNAKIKNTKKFPVHRHDAYGGLGILACDILYVSCFFSCK